MIRSRRLFFSCLALSALIFIADQFSKNWFTTHFTLHEQWPVIPDFFSFILAYNTGAAFSFLSSAGGWQRWFFIGLAAVVSLGLVFWLTRLNRTQKLQAVALCLILGGAIGNLWDRAFLGHVVDFILVHYKREWFFPAFNIADIAITVGAGLMILDTLIHPDHEQKKPAKHEKKA